MKILVVVGSLRAAAFSRKLANAAVALMLDGVGCEMVDGRDLPLYDQDLDGDEKPEPVRKLVAQLGAADGVVFVCPEFNYGIPGSLKNLVDWASRPAFRSPLKDKPALVIGLSIAPTGGARAHLQLSTVLAGTLTPVFVGPSLLVPAVHEKFDADGALTDEAAKLRLAKTLEQFAAWAAKPTGA
ncbi:MAG: NADPH-dependent FMN reductase [Myxococcota bacterium]